MKITPAQLNSESIKGGCDRSKPGMMLSRSNFDNDWMLDMTERPTDYI
jgi:hypothetical protein